MRVSDQGLSGYVRFAATHHQRRVAINLRDKLDEKGISLAFFHCATQNGPTYDVFGAYSPTVLLYEYQLKPHSYRR